MSLTEQVLSGNYKLTDRWLDNIPIGELDDYYCICPEIDKSIDKYKRKKKITKINDYILQKSKNERQQTD